jgi:hypothetical protein
MFMVVTEPSDLCSLEQCYVSTLLMKKMVLPNYSCYIFKLTDCNIRFFHQITGSIRCRSKLFHVIIIKLIRPLLLLPIHAKDSGVASLKRIMLLAIGCLLTLSPL